MNTKLQGDIGEDLAAQHFVALGYHIVKRNLRCRQGEVDIVVYKDDTLVFVEVKHWTTVPAEDLIRSIGQRKQRRIQGCARYFLQENPDWAQCKIRFDIVFLNADLTHYDNAFTENGFE